MSPTKLTRTELDVLTRLAQEGVMHVTSRHALSSTAKRLQEAGLVRAVPTVDEAGHALVLSGAGVQASRRSTLGPV